MLKIWLFTTLGNICYHLNGGLDALWKGSKLEGLMCKYWGIAYISFEQKEGRLPKLLPTKQEVIND